MQFLKLYLIIFIPKEDILFLLFHRLQNYPRPSLTSLKKKNSDNFQRREPGTSGLQSERAQPHFYLFAGTLRVSAPKELLGPSGASKELPNPLLLLCSQTQRSQKAQEAQSSSTGLPFGVCIL